MELDFSKLLEHWQTRGLGELPDMLKDAIHRAAREAAKGVGE